MANIQWDASLSVNNAEIDAQHQKWIKIYNTLDNSLLTGTVKANEGLETLKAMLDYARFHFSFEEGYMTTIGYPDLIAHRRAHKDFDSQLFSFYQRAEKGDLVLNSEIISILKEWLLGHIAKEDQDYARFQGKSDQSA